MHILLIDTCTERGLIAYGDSCRLLLTKELPFGINQSKFLMSVLTEALRAFGHPPPLDVIGVSVGPGSYTGIRVGVAVAQALAYSWKVPLVGVCSLRGFVPSEDGTKFAAVIDARIGGVYFQKGRLYQQTISYQGEPAMASLEEIGQHLQEVTHLITPKSLQSKFTAYYPHHRWIWEEKAPLASAFMQNIEQEYHQGKVIHPPDQLELLYLRETEAEREKKAQNSD